jgi:hypothetical protein
MGPLLLPCAPTGLFLVAGWGLMGATPRGQPWTLALMLPHGRGGLSARRLAVWWTFSRLLWVATCPTNYCATRCSI